MKKLLLLLLCVPFIVCGQDILFEELISVDEVIEFEELMYEKGMRYIEQDNICTYYKVDTSFFWNTQEGTEFHFTYEGGDDEFFELRKVRMRLFGKNFTEESKTASIFYEYHEEELIQKGLDKFQDATGMKYLKIGVGRRVSLTIQFANKNDFQKLWNSINHKYSYSLTNDAGYRIYEFENGNVDMRIEDRDGGITLITFNNYSHLDHPSMRIRK